MENDTTNYLTLSVVSGTLIKPRGMTAETSFSGGFNCEF